MDQQDQPLVAVELKRIGDLIETSVAAQAKSHAALEAWYAADLEFRQGAIKGQADLIRTTQTAQRIQRMAMLVIVVSVVILVAALAGSWYLDRVR